MSKRLLLTFVCLLATVAAWCAAPSAGKYYRINNVVSTDYCLAENYQTSYAVAAEIGTSKSYPQLWYYTGSSFQNVYTGHYIQNQSNSSQQFRTAATEINLNVVSMADGHFMLKINGNTLHCDGSRKIVRWQDDNNENSHWTFEEVTLTASEVAAARAEYQQYEKTEKEFASLLLSLQKADYTGLSTIFEDNACTKLKASYASMSDDALKAAVLAANLPEAIANIAIKVKNGWTDETDASMSADFRVQDYGAYAAAEPWRWNAADGRGLNSSQINDMNNPAGIYTVGRDVLFVFVEGTVPNGCELRLSAVEEEPIGTSRNNYNNGTQLRQGLNIIPAEPGLYTYWVMYSVTNKSLKPAEQPKVKIHIEGGHVMGYVNYYADDEAKTNAEYQRVLLAANASANATGADKCCLRLATRGNYGLANWQIMTYNQIWSDGRADLLKNKPSCTFGVETFKSTYYTKGYGFKIWKSMKFYDDVLHQEFALMGFLNDVSKATAANPVYNCFGGLDLYPTYCNCLAYTVMGTNGGNPFSTTGYTHMPGVGAVESSYNGERSNFDVWCVGHESGHNNQGAINLQSSTESSNNLFSNIITYWYGYRMSRGNTISDNEADFQNNIQFSLRDISMTMRMYYQLYLYYHTAGHKKDFYPTLFVDLRSDAMNLNNGRQSWLKFYQKACRAAQEDLTEFFRFWGFFVAFDTTTFGDYSNRTLSLSQETIDEAIAEIKAEAKEKGWRENLEIMFIEDRCQLRERTDIWAEAEKGGTNNGVSTAMKPDNGGNWRNEEYLHTHFGAIGDVLTYTNDAKPGNYTYTVSGTTVNMKGEGGVGFLLYNADGQIIGHSNLYSFTIPNDIATSEFSIKVINADGSMTECANETGVEQYREALLAAITTSKNFTSLSDETGTKMGYYTAEQLATLKEVVAAGQKILDEKSEDQYLSQYRVILAEISRVQAEEAVQKVNKVGIYTIESNRSRGHYLNGSAALTTASTKGEQQQWLFVPVEGDASAFYMQNMKTHAFLAPVVADSKLSSWTVSETTLDRAGTFTLEEAGGGSFFIKTNNITKGNYYINCDPSYNIAVWSADAGSKWNVVRVNEIEDYTVSDIRNVVTETNSLISTVCDFKTSFDQIPVQNTDKDAPYYITTNAAGIDPAHGLDYLIDNKSTTYFCTTGATVKAKRFVTLNLGEGNEVSDMVIYYRTANASQMYTYKPTQILVKAGEATASLKEIAVLTGLPNSTTKSETYQSPTITDGKDHRVWRFTVEATNSTEETTYPEFALAFLQFFNTSTKITPNAGYEAININVIKDAKAVAEETDNGLKVAITPLDNYNLYLAIKDAYDKLSDAASTTGIEAVGEATESTNNTVKGIFDINGRRLNSITKSGLYIINGKKVMVK